MQLAITLLKEDDMRINLQRAHLVDQLQSSIRRHGPQYALEHIDECVPVECFQGAVSRKSHKRFRIVGFYRPESYTKPSDLLVGVGQATVPLGDLASTMFGKVALQDLFYESEEDPQPLPPISHRDFDKAFEAWNFNSRSDEVCQARFDDGKCLVRWTCIGTVESYECNDLAQTAGGRALLDKLAVQDTTIGYEATASSWSLSEENVDSDSVAEGRSWCLCWHSFWRR